MKKRILRLKFFISVCVITFLFCSLPFLGNPAMAGYEEFKAHVKELKEKIKEAREAGKADEVKKLEDDLEIIRQGLKDREGRDPSISDEDASKLFHDISDFLGIDPYLELMPELGVLPRHKPEEEKEKDTEPEEEFEEFDYDQPPFTEAIVKVPEKKEGVAAGEAVATVTVKEVEKKKEREEPYPPMPLQEGLKAGALALAINGTGTTTRMACTLTNKTSDGCTVVIPTGTPIETESKDHQPYQTGYIPPIELGPGETETVEVPAYCTDSEKEPAPKDGSVAYALHEGPLTPEQEKITEIIVVTNALKQLHETCGKVAEPDDFLVAGGPPPITVPTPQEVPKPTEPYGPPEPEPEVYGPPPPAKPEPEEYGPPPPPEKPEPEEDEFAPLPPPEAIPLPGWWPATPEEWTYLFMFIKEVWSYRLDPLAPRPGLLVGPDGILKLPPWPEDFEGIPKPSPGPPELPPGMIELPPGWIILSLSGPLEFPGTTQFTLAEVPELKTNISSRKEKGEAVFSNPTGKVAVSLAPTEDPNIVKFDITRLEARAPSFKALDKSRGDINVALNSPENSTGTLNIKTGEVKGTVSVKAWGKKYKEPFPAAATYTGHFDFPTKKLGLNLRGTSFEPVDLEEGLYQRIRPEKFWDAVMLYSIWKETNDQGKEELAKVMTEQLRADFPKERAEGLAALVAEEIIHRVDEVHERHKKLKKEEVDFSILDPTLKLRKT